jgi:hypothetical protein
MEATYLSEKSVDSQRTRFIIHVKSLGPIALTKREFMLYIVCIR